MFVMIKQKIIKIFEKACGIKRVEISYSDYLKARSLETYFPLRQKVKIGFLLTIIVVCLVTPFTDWVIPFAVRLLK